MTHLSKTSILALAVATLMPAPCTAGNESAGSWRRLPDMAVPRWEAGSVVFEKRLYIFGGYRMPTKACKRVDVFDPKDDSWTKLADLPSAITHMNMVLDGRSVWFAGGFKNGITLALVGAVVGEFVAAQAGLGLLVEVYNFQMKIPLVFASIIILSITGLVLYGIMEFLDRKVVFWRTSWEEEIL